ncbi:3-isopropylmalate dehydratase small subunit [Helicovermis profundi]|uniref:3-isopropylmalate dehydratase small subunit n=1 Tax=Helicovermis profundi TaxID=3065157 RepID=A0AAU9EBG8_9FIRM|nr:3-isopropylmalate dehydratase small subunit [Clostridia bacterium S502]
MIIKGKVHKYGDNIDTDVIIPARYLNSSNSKELSKHCMEDIDSEFSSRVRRGDVIIAGENFGCGSSREHAPIAIKESGVNIVIAKSFARIFYRNAINIGLIPIENSEIYEKVSKGNLILVNTDEGIVNLSTGEEVNITKPSKYQLNILENGGLVNFIKNRISKPEGILNEI